MKVIVLSGATATGKTDLAVELAQRFKAEVVNFDSLLLYDEIQIGTAKPTLDEQQGIKHWMIGVRSISNPMNAADYSETATPIINEILSRKKNVILVGGSGFYLQALLKGMYDSPTTPADILERSDRLYQENGIDPFLEILKEHDPLSFQRYHANDHYRVRRAVEHFWAHGTPLSKARVSKDEENQKLHRPSIHDWPLLHLYLSIPKEEHIEIIRKRTRGMLNKGLRQEVEALLAAGFTGEEKPLLSIGYKETVDWICGKIQSEEECFDRIVVSTRQLAKAQRTWFNRDKSKESYHPLSQRSEIFERARQFFES